MKLLGEVLQCVNGYRAGEIDALVDEVDAPCTDRQEFIPAWSCCKSVRRNHSAPHHKKRLGRAGDDGLHADMRPLLAHVRGDRVATRSFNNVGEKRPLSNRYHRVIGDWHKDVDHWLALDACTHRVNALPELQNQCSSLWLAAYGLPEANFGVKNPGDAVRVDDIE